MKIFLIFIVAIAFFSCNDFSENNAAERFTVGEPVENVIGVTYKWTWSSGLPGSRNVKTTFNIDEKADGEKEVTQQNIRGASAFDKVVNSWAISDVFTFRNGNPDPDPSKRAWILEYVGNAKSVKMSWSATIEQKWSATAAEKIGIDTTATVEILFQVYAIIPDAVIPDNFDADNPNFDWQPVGRWPGYSNNLRPQAGSMLARFYSTSVFGKNDEENGEGNGNDEENGAENTGSGERKLKIEGDGEYHFVPLDFIILPPLEGRPTAKYFMQLYARMSSNDAKSNSYFEIDDGVLQIEFVY